MKRVLALSLSLILAGCATLQPDFETPTVEVVAVRMIPAEGILPRFNVDLRVTNPNRSDLPIKGATYSLELEGLELISGLTNDLPRIPAYGEETITLDMALNWMEGVKLLNQLAREPKDSLSYELKAKLDVGLLLPAIRVEETGRLSLAGFSSR